MKLTSLPIVIAVLLILICESRPDVLLMPATTGSRSESSLDRFRRGHSNVNVDHVDQLDSNTNVGSYDRESTAGIQSQKANIATAAGPFLSGAGSSGSNMKALTTEFDRGAFLRSNSRALNENGKQASSVLDTGITQGIASSDSVIGGSVAGVGSSFRNELQGRDQQISDADHIDQHLKENSVSLEQFDRGSSSQLVESAAKIGEGLGAPYGPSSTNEGIQAAQFDQSRSRGVLGAVKSLAADRNANVINEARNKQVVATTGANDVVLAGPGGASAGRAVAAEHLASTRNAIQHADSDESQVMNAAKFKALDNSWSKGSKESQAALANGAFPGAVSSGRSASQFATGHDRSAELGVVKSAARKKASSTTQSFDDRQTDRASRSNVLLGGLL